MTATTSAHRSAMQAVTGGALGTLSFSIGSLRAWQLATLDKLASVRGLKPNWDSYGSPPITDEVLDVAKKLVGEASVDATTPSVVPVSGGGVQMEWERGDRLLVLLVRADASIELYLEAGGRDFQTTVPSLNPAALTRLLAWLAEVQG